MSFSAGIEKYDKICMITYISKQGEYWQPLCDI